MTEKRSSASSSSGFGLIEVLISTFVVSIGLLAIVQLVGVTALQYADARETTTAVQQAQAKLDELMKLNLATAPAVQITPANPDSLTQNVANYFDTPAPGLTRRWRVQNGPAANTRLVTVRVVNMRARSRFGSQTDLTTVIRQW
jgi:type II secretory pathway pseudopilin PulG